MAVDPKILQKFLSNPANVKLDDMEDEAPVAPAEPVSPFPEGEEIQPEEMLEEEGVEEAPVLAEAAPQVDSKLKEKLMRLQKGLPADQEEDVSQDDVTDPNLDPQLRKLAIQKIKEKYLGKQ